jgi:hypothetical protein
MVTGGSAQGGQQDDGGAQLESANHQIFSPHHRAAIGERIVT